MKSKNEQTRCVPGFLRKTRPNAAVTVHNYFREWEKRHLNLKRKRSREILEHIAKNKKLSEKTVEFLNEQYPDIITEYLSWIVGEKAFAKSESINALFKTILSFATLEPSIFVGRGAYLLLPRERILAVRFIASDELRIKRLAKLLNMTEKEAAKNLDQADKEQRLFFKHVYGKKSIIPDEFDMVINLDYIHKPRWAAEIVAQAFKEKFDKISVD